MADTSKNKKKSAYDLPWWALILVIVIGSSLFTMIVYFTIHPLYGSVPLTVGFMFLAVAFYITTNIMNNVRKFMHPTLMLSELLKRHRSIAPLFFAFPVFIAGVFYTMAILLLVKSKYTIIITNSLLNPVSWIFFYFVIIPTAAMAVVYAVIFLITRKERRNLTNF